MMKLLKGICTTLLCSICVAVLALSISGRVQVNNGAIVPMHFGWGTATVLSGSMEPGIPIGSMIVIRQQDSYAPGDVITYRNEKNEAITHRIETIGGGVVTTRGDANNMADPEFPEDQIIGKLYMCIPSLGAVMIFLRQPVVLIVLATLALSVTFLPNIMKRKKSPEHE